MTDPDVVILQSPLESRHEALGARLIEFSGWRMPVQYTGILDEHRAVVRTYRGTRIEYPQPRERDRALVVGSEERLAVRDVPEPVAHLSQTDGLAIEGGLVAALHMGHHESSCPLGDGSHGHAGLADGGDHLDQGYLTAGGGAAILTSVDQRLIETSSESQVLDQGRQALVQHRQ